MRESKPKLIIVEGRNCKWEIKFSTYAKRKYETYHNVKPVVSHER